MKPKRRITMSNQDQFVRQTAALALPGGKSLPDMPMEAAPENSLEFEISQKPAVKSRLLSDMESLENWEHRGYGAMSLSNERFHEGRGAVLLTSPTKGERNFTSTRGRPWGSSSVIYRVDSEDWTEWNRITLWVYPDLPGFRTVVFNMVLHNDNRADTTVDNVHYDDA
jgi:hypothetical protein